VPAAAVIPAPIAYVKIAAVKKLVVGFLEWCAEPASRGECLRAPSILLGSTLALHRVECAIQIFYFEKIRVFKAGVQP